MDMEEELAKTARVEAASYWAKQIAAVACGVNCGMAPLLGSTAVTMFFGSAISVSYLTVITMTGFSSSLGTGEQLALLQEGGITAFATFLLTWTLAYTFTHN